MLIYVFIYVYASFINIYLSSFLNAYIDIIKRPIIEIENIYTHIFIVNIVSNMDKLLMYTFLFSRIYIQAHTHTHTHVHNFY